MCLPMCRNHKEPGPFNNIRACRNAVFGQLGKNTLEQVRLFTRNEAACGDHSPPLLQAEQVGSVFRIEGIDLAPIRLCKIHPPAVADIDIVAQAELLVQLLVVKVTVGSIDDVNRK